jgi:anaerobic selenocysteine-containing dehydrogenase
LCEALGVIGEKDYVPLRRALKFGRTAFALRFFWSLARNPKTMKYVAVLLYRTLGELLPKGMASAAPLWAVAQLYVRSSPKAAKAAGFGGLQPFSGDRLFRAMLEQPSGIVFAHSSHQDSWNAVGLPGHRIQLHIPELLPELAKLETAPPALDPEFPFVLSAGERRSDTSNTAVRNTAWHRRGAYGTLRLNPADAERLGCADGDRLRVTTRRASVDAIAEVTDTLQPGHVSLPNGQGLDYTGADGKVVRKGVPPNELTDAYARDFLAGTPWHKFVPARLEKVA